MSDQDDDATADEHKNMLRSYDIYDRAVDIVCAFEALFTRQDQVSATVVHFERFPTLRHKDGNKATPDFTVAFNDGTGLCGEIANISRYEKSVDGLCKQILRYDGLIEVPVASKSIPVEDMDVLCLVPAANINHAVERILSQRFQNNEHPYKPRKAPVLSQFSRDSDRYAFSRSLDQRNGSLSHAVLQDFINGGYNAPGSFWTPIKVLRPFMNDPTPPLYLATVIWVKVLPVVLDGLKKSETTISAICTALKMQYGHTRRGEVNDAVSLLQRGGFLKISKEGDKIEVKRGQRSGDLEDFPKLLAERACKKSNIKEVRSEGTRRGRRLSSRSSNQEQIALFDPELKP